MEDKPTGGTIILRGLTPSDHDAWLELWRAYQAFYEVSLSDAAVHCTWGRLLATDEPMYGALAVDPDGRAVGLVHWLTHRSTWTVEDYCYLQDLFVASHVRGGGVGRRLIEHVAASATAMGCARVYWLTHETNHTAMRLYDTLANRSGFVQYRRALGS